MGIIEIEHLTKKYGDNTAVDDLSLTIEKGKVYGFLGPNGAGKSTTMNIITGYIGATSGTVKIDGHDIFKEPEEAKKCVGYLPEMPPLYTDMTVVEYLGFVSQLKQIPKKFRGENVKDALSKTGTEQVKDRMIKNLSKGYRQRVGIAQAIIGMPEVIILDEPTVGLDPRQIIEIRELIKDLGKNHTVILSSHILSEISEVCEQIFIISRGKLAASGTEEELIEQMSDGDVVEIEVKGNQNRVSDVLKLTKGIDHTDFISTGRNDITSVLVRSSYDIRENIFNSFAKAGMPILGMNYKKKTLEEIFIQLTEDYVAPVDKKQQNEANSNNDTKENLKDNIDEDLSDISEEENTAVDDSAVVENTKENITDEDDGRGGDN